MYPSYLHGTDVSQIRRFALKKFWHFQFIFANNFSEKFSDAEILGNGQLRPCHTGFYDTGMLQSIRSEKKTLQSQEGMSLELNKF